MIFVIYLCVYISSLLECLCLPLEPKKAPVLQNGSLVLPEVTSTRVATTCKLALVDDAMWDKIEHLLGTDARLVRIHLMMNDSTDAFFSRDIAIGHLYQPNLWIKIKGKRGRQLLMLREQFETLSLTLLTKGIYAMNIKLYQEPSHCLEDLYHGAAEMLLRDLLYDLNSNRTVGGLEEICNLHINVTGKRDPAKFSYICCSRTSDGKMDCSYLKLDIWIRILFYILALVQIILVMYSPKFIPDTWYRKKNTLTEYIVKPNESNKLIANVKRLRDNDSDIPRTFRRAVVPVLSPCAKLRSAVRKMKEGSIYKLQANEVRIRVKANSILPENYAPVGLFTVLYNLLVRCKLRDTIKNIETCCYGNALKFCGKQLYWYKCLSKAMQLLLCMIAFIPWLIRFWFYYNHEEADFRSKIQASERKGAAPPITVGLTTQFSPHHPVFITVYSAIVLVFIAFQCFPERVKEKLKFVLKECCRREREISRLDGCAMVTDFFLFPMKKLGLFGLLVIPIWIPITQILMLLCLAIYFPLVNLGIRLLLNFLYRLLKTILNKEFFSEEKNEMTFRGKLKGIVTRTLVMDSQSRIVKRKNDFAHCFALILSTLMVFALVLLLAECISFLAEVLLYTVIGMILNPGSAMKYLSLFFLVCLYANQSFSSVRSLHLNFSKTLNHEVLKIVGDRVTEVAKLSSEEQVNTAFIVKTAAINEENALSEEKIQFVVGKNGNLKWKAPRLLLFLNKQDAPFIPRSFFTKLSTLNHFGCPGPIHLNYLKAAFEFLIVVVFLLFVFIVVIAFGDSQSLSAGSQSLAALAGGFIPLILRRFLMTSTPSPTISTSNLSWQMTFQEHVQKYQESWPLNDIDLDIYSVKPQPLEDTEKDGVRAATSSGDGYGSNEEMRLLNDRDETEKDGVRAATGSSADGHGSNEEMRLLNDREETLVMRVWKHDGALSEESVDLMVKLTDNKLVAVYVPVVSSVTPEIETVM